LLLCHGAGWKIKRKSQQTAAPWQERAFLNQISDDPPLTKIAEPAVGILDIFLPTRDSQKQASKTSSDETFSNLQRVSLEIQQAYELYCSYFFGALQTTMVFRISSWRGFCCSRDEVFRIIIYIEIKTCFFYFYS